MDAERRPHVTAKDAYHRWTSAPEKAILLRACEIVICSDRGLLLAHFGLVTCT